MQYPRQTNRLQKAQTEREFHIFTSNHVGYVPRFAPPTGPEWWTSAALHVLDVAGRQPVAAQCCNGYTSAS